MGSPQAEWENGQLDSWRSSGDFMFWPTGKHRFGWYLEPAYDYSFAGGHAQSIGMSGGLLIGIP
jgi:hypothetical protein